ncbi:hypothetical protein BAE44_0001381 [Dichanthelium oligosanthes]|uniref:Uncharacterized protein n=1 Tax=Dichanthelium oligosanthes TaxID=888268 RepID=A0A1E5WKD1_9POAL|nr:hypothetical protein BAE44_0001381 [Dichanthelium oligosanthes]
MANFAIDPRPHVPRGFVVLPHDLAAALKDFIQFQGVRLAEVQPSPIGDSFVRFSSPVEREHFFDRIIQFGLDYQLRFIKHDAGDNVRMHDLDRKAWLMLMVFPIDARSNTVISRLLLVRYFEQCKDSGQAASDHNPVQLDPTPSVHPGAAAA